MTTATLIYGLAVGGVAFLGVLAALLVISNGFAARIERTRTGYAITTTAKPADADALRVILAAAGFGAFEALLRGGHVRDSRGIAHQLIKGETEPTPPEVVTILASLPPDKLAIAFARLAGGAYLRPERGEAAPILDACADASRASAAVLCEAVAAHADRTWTAAEIKRVRAAATEHVDRALDVRRAADALEVRRG